MAFYEYFCSILHLCIIYKLTESFVSLIDDVNHFISLCTQKEMPKSNETLCISIKESGVNNIIMLRKLRFLFLKHCATTSSVCFQYRQFTCSSFLLKTQVSEKVLV